MKRRGRLRADDIGGITVIRICFAFTGEGMKGNRLLSNVVHEMEGGEREVRENGGEASTRRANPGWGDI